MIRTAFIILFLSLTFQRQTQLKVIVKNVEAGKGSVFAAAYNDKSSFLKKPFTEKSIKASNTTMELNFDLPQGEYAIAVYQDINGNKQLDHGIFNIPKEPTGFSNNFHPRFSAPEFKDAAMTFDQPSMSIVVELK